MSKKEEQKENLPVKAGTFYPANSDELIVLPKELEAEFDDSDNEGYEEAREALPIVSIRQKDKKDEQGKTLVEAGGFKCYDAIFQNLNDISGDKGLTVSIMMDQPSRIYWKQDQMDHPACRSRDGMTGQGRPGGNCTVCPLAQWKENGDRPECAAVMNLLCHDHEFSILYVFNVKRSGLKPYNNFKVLLRRSGPKMGLSVDGKPARAGIPLHFTKILITTEFRQEPAPHYVPVFSVKEILGVPMIRTMKEFRQKSSASFGKTIEAARPEDDENGSGVSDPVRQSVIESITKLEAQIEAVDKGFVYLTSRGKALGTGLDKATDDSLVRYMESLQQYLGGNA